MSKSLMEQSISEYDVQLAVCDYIRMRYPGVPFNSDGAGNYTTTAIAGRTKALRIAAGWPDLIVCAARGKYHGLFLELKAPNADPYEPDGITLKGGSRGEHLREQEGMLEMLQKQGYASDFATGFAEAKWKLDYYMGLPPV